MRWSWRGAVALVLATSVGVGFAVSLVRAAENPDHLSKPGAALLYAIGGTIVGGVIGWLSTGRDGGGNGGGPGDQD